MLVDLVQFLVSHSIDVHVLVKEHVVMVTRNVPLAVHGGVISEFLRSGIWRFVAVSFGSICESTSLSIGWRVLTHKVVVGSLNVRKIHLIVRAITNTSV